MDERRVARFLGAPLVGRVRPIAGAFVATLLLCGVAGLPGAGSAPWAPDARGAGFLGYDLSWPNCSATIPPAAGFAVVGVTGGLPFTHNPCLGTEFRWARRARSAAFYVNVDAASGPAARLGSSGPAGPGCGRDRTLCRAYHYGWDTARDAWLYAARALGTPNLQRVWWLDVELGRWTSDTTVNARTIECALDFLHSKGRRTGIYSTDYQWRTIAGTYRPRVDAWYATVARTRRAAARFCDSSRFGFTGGRIRIVQYQPDGRVDADYRCPA
jgi:hypothetical protein